MSKPIDFAVAPTLHAPTASITRIVPDVDCDFKKCEVNVHIGLFFDGTNNNRERDRPALADSNIARLWLAYNEKTDLGYYPIYVPGVGTRFPEIGEDGESDLGAGFANGCEGRVVYGLLALVNSLHRRAYNGEPLFDSAQVRALCRNNKRVDSTDEARLAAIGATAGLLCPDLFGEGERKPFLQRHASFLEAKLAKGKPKIVGCFVDVFGFSRGAAEARVFCSWLDQLLIGGKLAGVKLRLRFLGVMDTVASAGFWSGATSFVVNGTGGHSGWAASEFLRIPKSVENCVHMVAMHELRRNFPLDEIGVNGVFPKGCHQYAYPGSHSDVGGGYAPGELGVSVGKNAIQGDAMKLSQIPLNHMLECAIAAGAPMSKRLSSRSASNYDPFALAPELLKAYEEFLSTSTLAPRSMNAWLQPYLNWRWQVRATHAHLNQVKHASQHDRDILTAHNNRLISDAALMQRTQMSNGKRAVAIAFNLGGARLDHARLAYLDPEARQVLKIAQQAKPTSPALANFFDNFVHDSLAGFDKPAIEPTGYWRYRKGFMGGDAPKVVSNEQPEGVIDKAA